MTTNFTMTLLRTILDHADKHDGSLVVTCDGAAGWLVQYGYGQGDEAAGHAVNTHDLETAIALIDAELDETLGLGPVDDDDHPWGPARYPQPGDHSDPCIGVCDHHGLSCPTCTTRTPSSRDDFQSMVQHIVTVHDDNWAIRDDQLALLCGRYAAVAFTPRRWEQTPDPCRGQWRRHFTLRRWGTRG